MSKFKVFLNGIVALVLVLTALGASFTPAQAGKGNDELKADPRLLQMAEENPEAVFMVIVQKEAKNKDLEEVVPEIAVERSGGRVTKQLDLITSFSAELTGKELTKLAKNPKVRWISADAPMVSTAGPGMDTVRDEFSSTAYTGNNGTAAWSSNWLEAGESDGASKGFVSVISDSTYCASSRCLRLGYNDDKSVSAISVRRTANLEGAVYASLTYSYRRRSSSSSVKVTVAASKDGTNWTNLLQHTLNGSDSAQIVQSIDLTPYASANTTIRFLISGSFPEEKSTYLYIDNIQIEYARASNFLSAVKSDQLSLNGQGVTVAVLDSGISNVSDLNNGDGSSRVVANVKFGNLPDANDGNGHGTFVAGVIGANGASSNGKYKGVAPGVNLINVRVSDAVGMSYESDLVAGLQWIYDNRTAYNIRVVNISMNSTVAQSYHTSPLAAAVEILWFNGIVVVVSAGNNGTANGPSILYPPANDPFVITVGATEDKGTASLADDTMTVFSAYGATEDGFAKPDLVAPGRNLVNLLAGTTADAYTKHPKHRVPNNGYFRMSGTSMSAPVVTGAVALLLQDEAGLTPDQVKYRLMATANKTWTGYNASKAGAGYLDVYAAVNGTTTQSANIGILASQMLSSGSDSDGTYFGSVGWNSVGWNSVGWNSVGWNSVGWNSVGWNTTTWDD